MQGPSQLCLQMTLLALKTWEPSRLAFALRNQNKGLVTWNEECMHIGKAEVG